MINLNKAQTADTLTVLVKTIGQAEQKTYEGRTTETKTATVDYNGTEYYLTVKPKDYNKVAVGLSLMLIKKLYKNHPYFEIYPATGAPIVREDLPPTARPQDNQDRILRSQCLNLSVQMFKDITPLTIKGVAEQIYVEVKDWVNGK